MKILFAIKSINHKGGGAEKVLSLVASGLARRKHEVYLLSFDENTDDPFYPLDPGVIKIGLGVGNVRLSASFGETFVRILTMRKRIKALKPDIAIGFMHSMFVPLGISMLFSRIPVIGSDHIVFSHYKNRKLESLLFQLSQFYLKKIVVVSEQAKKTYPGYFQKNMAVVSNPIITNVESKANVIGINNEKKVLLTVGRLTEQKDHKTLIRAFALICDQFPDWVLHIVGDGELRGFLEAIVDELNLNGKVFLKSTTKNIAVEYSNAQLFVLPSLYESFGLVVIEALSHQLPVVGFAECDGVNELIHDNKNGILVHGSNGRVEALSVALQNLMGNSQLRLELSKNCCVPNGYDINSVLDSWETIFDHTIGG